MKAKRHSTILRILRSREIETQEDLLAELGRRGIDVTQATVSRDINELGLIKVPTGDGRYRWGLPQQPVPGDLMKRVRRAFRDYVVDIDYSGNLIVVRTSPGTAHAVAIAIDDLRWESIIGTVAGDDAILVIVKDDRQAQQDADELPPGLMGEVLQRFTNLRA